MCDSLTPPGLKRLITVGFLWRMWLFLPYFIRPSKNTLWLSWELHLWAYRLVSYGKPYLGMCDQKRQNEWHPLVIGLLCLSHFCHRHSVLPLFNFSKCHSCHHFYLGDPHIVFLNPTIPIYILLLNLRNQCFGLDESATQLNDVVWRGWNHGPFQILSVGPMIPVCSSVGVWVLRAGFV